MVMCGDELANPLTGERLVVRKTSAETGGAAVVVETLLRPYATGAGAHLHPAQEERFEVVAGSVGFQTGLEQLVAGPGHRRTVAPGTPHRFWNAGDEEARILSEIRPALQFEQLLTALFALAADGNTGAPSRGPNPVRLAVVLHAHRDTIRPVSQSLVDRLFLAFAGPIGRLLGYPPVVNGQSRTRGVSHPTSIHLPKEEHR